MLYIAGILFNELLFGGGSGVLFNELRKPAEKARTLHTEAEPAV